MNKRSIIAALLLVNGPLLAAAKTSAANPEVSGIVAWIERTGKERDDYNQEKESAELIGLKPGEAIGKARGAQGKDGQPDRYAHLFSPKASETFLVLKRGLESDGRDDTWTFKIALDGKVLKAYRVVSEVGADGELIRPKFSKLKINAATKKSAAQEIAFWAARTKQDAQPGPAKP